MKTRFTMGAERDLADLAKIEDLKGDQPHFGADL
jgi:hypothetical protein